MSKKICKKTLSAAHQRTGVSRLVIVGGTSRAVSELRERMGPSVRLKLVDGTKRVSRAYAANVAASADLVVIWAPTPLHHSVSRNFKAVTPKGKRMQIRRRGVASLIQEINDFLENRETAA